MWKKLTLGAILLAGCAGGQEHARQMGMQASAIDQEFVRAAASAGMFEVQSSQIALAKGDLGPLQSYAQRMVSEHSGANRQLIDVAQNEGYTLPDALLPQHREMIQELQQTPEGRVADTYAQQQMAAHQQSVEIFERCASDCQNAELRSFAQQTLPTLRSHLRMLERQPVGGEG